jgi:hypothetical protein
MAMQLPRVVFFGRTGSDALQFFHLDLADWRGARILDCPGGPGSLVATARRNGVEAVAVEPLLTQLPPRWAGQLTTTAYDQGYEGASPLLLLERGGPDRT